jgi:hypothetical protein
MKLPRMIINIYSPRPFFGKKKIGPQLGKLVDQTAKPEF